MNVGFHCASIHFTQARFHLLHNCAAVCVFLLWFIYIYSKALLGCYIDHTARQYVLSRWRESIFRAREASDYGGTLK